MCERQTALPWMSFGSDAEAAAPEGVFLKSSTHPRAYGNFARLLGKYVRDGKAAPLADAMRRLTSLPGQESGLKDRGMLRGGMTADVVVFDPATIGTSHVREAAAVCHRCPRRLRQRRAGPQRRATYRREAGTICEGARLDGLARWRSLPRPGPTC